MTAARANIAAHLIHTTDTAGRRLTQEEPSRWPGRLKRLVEIAAFLALIVGGAFLYTVTP